MISGSRAALLNPNRIPIVKLAKFYVRPLHDGPASPRTASSEGVMLIPAIAKNSTTGYKNVAYDRSKMKFQAKVKAGGQHVRLGYFDTAEEAATAYAQSEYGRADAAKLLQPRPAPTPAARWRRGDTAGGEGGPDSGRQQQQQHRLQGRDLLPEAERQQEVQAGGDGWRQAAPPRLLRHRRGGCALLRPQGGGHGHARQRSHCAAAAAAVLNLCGAASVRAQHSDA